MRIPKLPEITKSLTEGEFYCPCHSRAIEPGKDMCPVCEWAAVIDKQAATQAIIDDMRARGVWPYREDEE